MGGHKEKNREAEKKLREIVRRRECVNREAERSVVHVTTNVQAVPLQAVCQSEAVRAAFIILCMCADYSPTIKK